MQNNNEAMPRPHDNRVVHLPLYDKETGETLPGYLQMDVGFFLEQSSRMRHDFKIVEFEDFDLDRNRVALPEYPDPTPEQEIDIMDRIIHGLPMRTLVIPHESHEGIADVVLYDVASKHPKEFFSDWYRVPAYDNYEINSAGEVRNRWTRRVLEVAEQGGEQYVEMHDKEGFAHDINVRYIKEQVFGN